MMIYKDFLEVALDYHISVDMIWLNVECRKVQPYLLLQFGEPFNLPLKKIRIDRFALDSLKDSLQEVRVRDMGLLWFYFQFPGVETPDERQAQKIVSKKERSFEYLNDAENLSLLQCSYIDNEFISVRVVEYKDDSGTPKRIKVDLNVPRSEIEELLRFLGRFLEN